MTGIRSVRIGGEFDVLSAIALSQECAEALGMDATEVTTVEIVVGELACNLVRHAGGGTLTLNMLGGVRPGLEIVADDDGPGFADVGKALADGYSRGRLLDPDNRVRGEDGLGSGLGAVARFADDLEIVNKPGGGARVTVLKRSREGMR